MEHEVKDAVAGRIAKHISNNGVFACFISAIRSTFVGSAERNHGDGSVFNI